MLNTGRKMMNRTDINAPMIVKKKIIVKQGHRDKTEYQNIGRKCITFGKLTIISDCQTAKWVDPYLYVIKTPN